MQIRQATRARIPALTNVLGRAFATDPLAVWPMKPGSGHAEVSQFFALYDGELVDEGWLWEAGDAAGAAFWVPPGRETRYGEVDERITKPAVQDELSDDEGARYEMLWDWVWRYAPEEHTGLTSHMLLGEELPSDLRGVPGLALVRCMRDNDGSASDVGHLNIWSI